MNRKMKALTLSIAVSFMLGIYACSDGNNAVPLPSTPTPEVSYSTNPTEASTPTQKPTAEPTREHTTKPETVEPKPTATVTSSDAGTPAVEFAARWGKRYPDVPEFAILKAANGTCRILTEAGDNWNDSTVVMNSIEVVVGTAGIKNNDALEFAQDADQNYCASVSNPT